MENEKTIRGIVTDVVSGESLPAANIIIEDSYSGTISNQDGYYSLVLDTLPVTITVRYIGYHSASRVISEESDLVQDFSLEPATIEMDEIVVTDRDPALSIMERVIERKKIWRAGLESYSAEAYTRQVLENDTTIVSITETVSKAYWDADRGHREVLKSQRQTSNMGNTTNLTGVSYQPNFYDDDIEIAGFTLVGPTHPDALSYYHFRLDEILKIDDKLVYKIDMEPRRRLQPTFRGTLYVLEEEYALLEVRLKPNEVVRFPSPVREFDLDYEQQFDTYGGEFWLPVDMRISGQVRIEMIGLKFPPIKFRQLSRISDYEVNSTLPDTLYEEGRVFRVDTTSIHDTALLEASLNRVPLTLQEEVAYETIDSTATLERAFQPSGFLARALMDEDGEASGGDNWVSFLGKIIPDGLEPRILYNRVDGFHLGLSYSHRFDPVLVQINSGYNTNTEFWDYGGGVEVEWMNHSRVRSVAVLNYSISSVPRYDSRFPVWLNSMTTLAGSIDYFDYFRNEKTSAGLRFDIPGANLKTGIFYQRETHSDIVADLLDYSLINWHETIRQNPPVEEGELRSLSAEIGINVQKDNFGVSGNRSAHLKLEHSQSWLGSDFHFTKAELKLNWNLVTFYQRRLFPNTLDLYFSTGASSGDLPIQRHFTIDGSFTGFTPFGVLKTRRNLPYEGDRFWLFYAEHNFRSIPFELVGLHSIADRGWSLMVFGGAGQTTVRSDQFFYQNGFRPYVSDSVHLEAGVSLNTLFGFLRIDFAKRLDSPGFYAGFSLPRYF